ncbi:MAG: hypothetical protein ACRDH6_06080 [Actinomycetota bacterium]
MNRVIMRVLVMTEAPEVLLPCRVNLEFAGHEVIAAHSVPEGAVRAKEDHPDAIALDVALLSRGGFALLWQLALHRSTSEVPVILIADPGETNGSNGSVGHEIAATILTPSTPGRLPDAIWRLGSMNGVERSVRRPSRVAVSLLTKT